MPLEFERRYPILRVYFNCHSDWPKIWSVDDGDQKNEVNVETVLMEGVGVATGINEKPNPESPVAWVQFFNAELRQFENGVVISNSD